MGEIKRFDFEMHNHGGCDMNYCDMCYTEIEEAEDGEYIKYEDHLKAIAEAEGAAVVNNPPPAPSAHVFWYSTINLERLNNGYTIIAEGVEYCLAGKELFCRASEKEPFEACGDMKADDFIKVLILGEHKK